MIRKLPLLFMTFFLCSVSAQNPTIEGDTMMCPYTDGTAYIVTAQAYDSYQWYYKYWFTTDEFELIDGATDPSFTYDWMTYDQALLKVIVTVDGEPFESNTIQIDSHAWMSMFIMYELDENAYFDPDTETIMLCNGASFEVSINNPPYDSSITWYIDGVALADANDSSFLITQPGTYEVSAAPSFCPNNLSYSLPITVAIDPDCSLQTPDNSLNKLTIYPNPATDVITIGNSRSIRSYSIVDISGKTIQQGELSSENSTIDISTISSGMYILQLSDGQSSTAHKIIKH